MADEGTIQTPGGRLGLNGLESAGASENRTDFSRASTLTGVFLAAGLIILVAVATSCSLWRLLTHQWWPSWHEMLFYVIGVALVVAAGICGATALKRMDGCTADPLCSQYDSHLVGLGYALLLLATLNFVALADFAKLGVLQYVLSASFGSSQMPGPNAAQTMPDPSLCQMLFLLLLPGFGALGALFFHANSLREKAGESGTTEKVSQQTDTTIEAKPQPQAESTSQPKAGPTASAIDPVTGKADPGQADSKPPASQPVQATGRIEIDVKSMEPFSNAKFWGGLWYRMGEAVLYSLVVFLVVVGYGQSSGGIAGPAVLLTALLLGMFVKTGESLIHGIADKLFDMVRALVK